MNFLSLEYFSKPSFKSCQVIINLDDISYIDFKESGDGDGFASSFSPGGVCMKQSGRFPLTETSMNYLLSKLENLGRYVPNSK
jgi:hypothetical protein